MYRQITKWLQNLETKKGQMTMEGGLSNGLMLVVLTIAIGIGATILVGIQTGQTVNGTAFNITAQGLTGLTQFASQFGNVGLVLAAALILTTLVVGLGMFFTRRQ